MISYLICSLIGNVAYFLIRLHAKTKWKDTLEIHLRELKNPENVGKIEFKRCQEEMSPRKNVKKSCYDVEKQALCKKMKK